jgi:hypothetical protein
MHRALQGYGFALQNGMDEVILPGQLATKFFRGKQSDIDLATEAGFQLPQSR